MSASNTIKDRPIILSGTEIRAILERGEARIRRVITHSNSEVDGYIWNKERFASLDFNSPNLHEDTSYRTSCGCLKYLQSSLDDDPTCGHRVRSRWRVGDRLWVKETFFYADEMLDIYAREYSVKWRSPIHMPRWASRITLEITDVRAEMSGDDAQAEGLLKWVWAITLKRVAQ